MAEVSVVRTYVVHTYVRQLFSSADFVRRSLSDGRVVRRPAASYVVRRRRTSTFSSKCISSYSLNRIFLKLGTLANAHRVPSPSEHV